MSLKHAYNHFLLLLISNGALLAQVSLTYTGNMGVLLRSETQTLLIDGLHEYYGPAYQHPSSSMIEDLLTDHGKYPVPKIVMVTHHHRDHFSAKLHRQLPNTWIIGSKQVVDSLEQRDPSSMSIVPYMNYEAHYYQGEGISIEAFRMDHVNQARHHQVQNIGFLVQFGSHSVLHVGDTDWHESLFEKLDLPPSVDIAILPVWMLMHPRSKDMVRDYLNPKHLVVTHIDPRNSISTVEQIHSEFPDAILLTQLGETHTF